MDIENYCTHLNNLVEDTREGTLVCRECCRVVELNLSYQVPKISQNREECSGKVYSFISDVCHRMHLPMSVINGINHQYIRFKKLHCFKKTNYEILAAYTMYYFLKQENVGRTIETIAYFTGVDSNRIWKCELNDESIIRAHFKYLDLNEEDCHRILQFQTFSKIAISLQLLYQQH